MTILGVLSDTHIPDRASSLHPGILTVFRQAGVEAILHGGDISTPRVIDELATLAPVYAVRGNRDWLFLRRLPRSIELSFEGVPIALVHGHGRWWNYLIDRSHYMLKGYRLQRFQPRLLRSFPAARVIIFGHTHRPLNLWVNEQLLFNPGSPHFPDERQIAPSVGLLHIQPGGNVSGEIVFL